MDANDRSFIEVAVNITALLVSVPEESVRSCVVQSDAQDSGFSFLSNSQTPLPHGLLGVGGVGVGGVGPGLLMVGCLAKER